MPSSSKSPRLLGPLGSIVHDSRFLVKPVFPSTEEIELALAREVKDFADTFYKRARLKSIVTPSGCASPQDIVLARYAELYRKTDAEISSLVAEVEKLASERFNEISRKHLLGGSMGPPTTVSDVEKYVLKTLSYNPAHYLKRRDIVSFITARCLTGDVPFFERLGRKLQSFRGKDFDPFSALDYRLAQFWTHPWMPLWMMTDEAGSTALSVAVGRTVLKEAFKKVRTMLELPNFPKRAIREAKRFRNRELEYVYYSWVKVGSKRGKT